MNKRKSLKLIIPESIKRKDFGKEISNHQVEVLKKFFLKSHKKPAKKKLGFPKNTSLIKTYATSKDGAAIIVFLLLLSNDNKVLLFYLLKKDKKIGTNITSKNNFFYARIKKEIRENRKRLSREKI